MPILYSTHNIATKVNITQRKIKRRNTRRTMSCQRSWHNIPRCKRVLVWCNYWRTREPEFALSLRWISHAKTQLGWHDFNIITFWMHSFDIFPPWITKLILEGLQVLVMNLWERGLKCVPIPGHKFEYPCLPTVPCIQTYVEVMTSTVVLLYNWWDLESVVVEITPYLWQRSVS